MLNLNSVVLFVKETTSDADCVEFQPELLNVFENNITGRYRYCFSTIHDLLKDPEGKFSKTRLKIEVSVLAHSIERAANQLESEFSCILDEFDEKVRDLVNDRMIASDGMGQASFILNKLGSLSSSMYALDKSDVSLLDYENVSGSCWDTDLDYGHDDLITYADNIKP